MKLRIFKNKKDLIEKLIRPTDVVLDVGFWGQGITTDDSNWVHSLLKRQAKDVYGIDLDYDTQIIVDSSHYKKQTAEDFDFGKKFDVIFAGDLIEHLSNPGLFLSCATKNLKPGGKLIITTPNTFNLFNLAEKISKEEPTVNRDHTCYFNSKTLRVLLKKNKWDISEVAYLYTLGLKHKESWKKQILNIFYYIASLFTVKYVETLVIVAQRELIET